MEDSSHFGRITIHHASAGCAVRTRKMEINNALAPPPTTLFHAPHNGTGVGNASSGGTVMERDRTFECVYVGFIEENKGLFARFKRRSVEIRLYLPVRDVTAANLVLPVADRKNWPLPPAFATLQFSESRLNDQHSNCWQATSGRLVVTCTDDKKFMVQWTDLLMKSSYGSRIGQFKCDGTLTTRWIGLDWSTVAQGIETRLKTISSRKLR